MLQPSLDETVTLVETAALMGTPGATLRSWRHRQLIPSPPVYTVADVLSLVTAQRLTALGLDIQPAAKIALELTAADWPSFIRISNSGDRVWLVVRPSPRGLEYVVAADTHLALSAFPGAAVVDLGAVARTVLTAKRGARTTRPGVLLIEAPATPVSLPVATPAKETVR